MIIVWVLQCTMRRLAVLGTVIGPNPRQGRKGRIGNTSQTTLGWHNTSFFFSQICKMANLFQRCWRPCVFHTTVMLLETCTVWAVYLGQWWGWKRNNFISFLEEAFWGPNEPCPSCDLPRRMCGLTHDSFSAKNLRERLSCLSLKEVPTRSWASLHLN